MLPRPQDCVSLLRFAKDVSLVPVVLFAGIWTTHTSDSYAPLGAGFRGESTTKPAMG